MFLLAWYRFGLELLEGISSRKDEDSENGGGNENSEKKLPCIEEQKDQPKLSAKTWGI